MRWVGVPSAAVAEGARGASKVEGPHRVTVAGSRTFTWSLRDLGGTDGA